MPKETKLERAAREKREQEARELASAEFRKTLPERLMKIVAKYQSISNYPDVKLTASGPSVRFYHDGEFFVDEVLTYESDEWDVQHVETAIDTEISVRAAAKQRYEQARSAWEKVAPADRILIREFIGNLL